MEDHAKGGRSPGGGGNICRELLGNGLDTSDKIGTRAFIMTRASEIERVTIQALLLQRSQQA